MKINGYTPYCGNMGANNAKGGCHNPRTYFDGNQFFCPFCGWRSSFETDFINRYKKKWGAVGSVVFFSGGRAHSKLRGVSLWVIRIPKKNKNVIVRLRKVIEGSHFEIDGTYNWFPDYICPKYVRRKQSDWDYYNRTKRIFS